MPELRTIKLNEAIADEKYLQFRNKDPFEEIPSALLNSSDIINYVDKVSLLNPFYVNEEFLKPASYSIRIEGTYIYWEDRDKIITGSLEKEGDFFILKRNTIAFISLECRLRLPHYIAARFNLQIKHVHRGILLGTGPLVDPGFKGGLLIPLHNLTNNDYKIPFHEPIIWMEFTKISNSFDFKENMGDERKGNFFPFKNSSVGLSPEQYLAKASPHSPIVNSFSTLIEDEEELISRIRASQQTIDNATRRVETTQRTINIGVLFTFAGLLAMFAALINLVIPDVREIRKNQTEKVKEFDEKLKRDSLEIEFLKMKIMNEPPKDLPSKTESKPKNASKS